MRRRICIHVYIYINIYIYIYIYVHLYTNIDFISIYRGGGVCRANVGEED